MDMGYAHPLVLSADSSYTCEWFAAIFEVHGGYLRQFELGIRWGGLGRSLWRSAVRTWRHSSVQLMQSAHPPQVEVYWREGYGEEDTG